MEGQHSSAMHPFFINLERVPLCAAGGAARLLELLPLLINPNSTLSLKIYCPDPTQKLKQLLAKDLSIVLYERELKEEDLLDFSLLILAFPQEETEDKFIELAKKHRMFVHVYGKWHLSDFSLVSVIGNRRIKLGVSSNDYPYQVQRRLNHLLERNLPPDLDEFIEKLQTVYKHPLLNKEQELRELDHITMQYLQQLEPKALKDSEFENMRKVKKAVQKRANIYLGIIGVFLITAVLGFILINFNLTGDLQAFLAKDAHMFYKMMAIGFLAEIVAGSMGMGYGVICTTVLLLMNVAPAVVSASIHSAETFTSAAGSISHYKLRNVNLKLVKALAPPAILGAIIGALALSYFGEHYAPIVKPLISLYTLYLGINILRNASKKKTQKRNQQRTTKLGRLGLVGGFIDSFAGGGWGPLVTGTLMKDGRTPRYVVGSSTVSKFLLTLTSAITFIITMGIEHWNIVLGLLIGGIITAPFSALLTSRLPVRMMFRFIGITVIVMSCITIGRALL